MRDGSRSHCQRSRKSNKVYVAETCGGIGLKGDVKMARNVREVRLSAPA